MSPLTSSPSKIGLTVPALFSPWAASFFATVTNGGNICMGKVRRGNYVFLTWKGDHSPRHVHVYRDSRRVVKWDLEHWHAMEGKANRRLIHIIALLEQDGVL